MSRGCMISVGLVVVWGLVPNVANPHALVPLSLSAGSVYSEETDEQLEKARPAEKVGNLAAVNTFPRQKVIPPYSAGHL